MCLIFLFGQPAGGLFLFADQYPVLVDIFNHQFADDDEGNRQKHTGTAQKFAAQHNAENDGNGVQIQRFANQSRIDEVVIHLR